MLKIVFLLILSILSPLQVQAKEPGKLEENKAEKRTTEWFYSDWNRNGKVTTSAVSYETQNRWDYEVKIDQSANKGFNLYLTIEERNSDICVEEDENLPSVIKVDEQNVSVYAWCKTYTDTKEKYVQFTAKTNKGSDFIINAFKKSKIIKIDFNSLGAVHFSAYGFAKTWSEKTNIL